MRLLAERISHERELRLAAEKAFDHERELRRLHDLHERELRLQTEKAVEHARDIQFREYERRLEEMNRFREENRDQTKTFLPIDRFEREHEGLEGKIDLRIDNVDLKRSTDHEILVKLVTQVGTLRGIAVFLGVPGVLALLWALAKAFVPSAAP